MKGIVNTYIVLEIIMQKGTINGVISLKRLSRRGAGGEKKI